MAISELPAVWSELMNVPPPLPLDAWSRITDDPGAKCTCVPLAIRTGAVSRYAFVRIANLPLPDAVIADCTAAVSSVVPLPAAPYVSGATVRSLPAEPPEPSSRYHTDALNRSRPIHT